MAEKFCPFSVGFTSTKCPHTEASPPVMDCNLWDSVNERCGMKITDLTLNNIDENPDSIINIIKIVLGTYGDARVSLLNGIEHIHNQHMHSRIHGPEAYGLTYGATTTAPPYATMLLNEFMNGQDIDGNGLLYGTDFYIRDSTGKPKTLKMIESNPDWSTPTTSMTWVEYLASMGV